MQENSAQQKWRKKTLEYVTAINAYVEVGLRDGWDVAGKEPHIPKLDKLASSALDAVREANATRDLEKLRELWPPNHGSIISLLESNGQSIPTICILPDDSIVARIGASYEKGYVVRIDGESVTIVPDIKYFGQSPNRRYFAIARKEGVQILDGWEGPKVAFCRWPTGLENIPSGFKVEPCKVPPRITQLIPFSDGKRVLLVGTDGIFVLTPGDAHRLLPTTEQLREQFSWSLKDNPEDILSFGLSMEHGAISSDGKFIAVGSQDSTHLIYDGELSIVGSAGNFSEYPHFALFDQSNSMIAFNSCHFYNGATIGVPTKLLPGLETEPYTEDPRITMLQDGARVYAGVSRNDEFIVGDANGYVLAFSNAGSPRWQFFIGSTISGMDLSPDNKTLVVSSYAGFLSIIKLDAGKQEPHQIGNSHHAEIRRWLFWKNEPKPLIW